MESPNYIFPPRIIEMVERGLLDYSASNLDCPNLNSLDLDYPNLKIVRISSKPKIRSKNKSCNIHIRLELPSLAGRRHDHIQ